MRNGEPVLEVENLRFSYMIRHSIFRKRSYPAIQGVSFSISSGETVGIIGRNGCGKSTLLRLIAGIYRPDDGYVKRHCKRVSLLSLALGFDPELTGRDNAVLSGMLSGSSRVKVESEMDHIIEFADLGAFIDEPIKTYSSGMRARLGFSVALKLQTDLLLLDEVLSVGDANFRAKAEKAMKERINSQQTVLMVSHSFGQLCELCNRVIWIDKGKIRAFGDPKELTKEYLAEVSLNQA